jgi:hypothetical protein
MKRAFGQHNPYDSSTAKQHMSYLDAAAALVVLLELLACRINQLLDSWISIKPAAIRTAKKSELNNSRINQLLDSWISIKPTACKWQGATAVYGAPADSSCGLAGRRKETCRSMYNHRILSHSWIGVTVAATRH